MYLITIRCWKEKKKITNMCYYYYLLHLLHTSLLDAHR